MDEKDRGEADRLDFAAAPAKGSVAGRIGTKNLLIIIVTMPFVFLAVVMTIIGVFGRPGEEKIAAAPASVRSTPVDALEQPAGAGARATLPTPASMGDVSTAIVLPQGVSAGAISLDGDRLAVRVNGDSGAMIVIYDLASKSVIQTIPLVETVGSAMGLAPMQSLGDELTAPDANADLQEDANADGSIPTPRLATHRANGN